MDLLWSSCKTTAALIKEKKYADQKRVLAEKEAHEAAMRAEKIERENIKKMKRA